jgi:hypothetical protein
LGDALLHDLFAWVQHQFGDTLTRTDRSLSGALDQSLNFWAILEGTHLLMLMLFFGTIFIVDLRLLGVHLKKTPVSVVSDRLLPWTVVSLGIVVATGALLFFSEPLFYYHKLWFRVKVVLLVLAMANVVLFHKLIQHNQAEWDAAPSPPPQAKTAALMSLVCWLLIIACGRMTGYDLIDCGRPLPDWLNALQECAASEAGATSLSEAAP